MSISPCYGYTLSGREITEKAFSVFGRLKINDQSDDGLFIAVLLVLTQRHSSSFSPNRLFSGDRKCFLGDLGRLTCITGHVYTVHLSRGLYNRCPCLSCIFN